MTTTTASEEISLLESLDAEWIKLPLEIMQDVGPAVQTLGGLLKLTNKETYVPVGDIARRARLPVATVRKHLLALDAGGWIANHGRQHTRRGRPRRTCTITLAKQTKDKIEPYTILPWWACCRINKVGKLPWSVKAVLSVVMARLAALKAGAQRQGDHDGDAKLIGAIDNMGGQNRFCFSLASLVKQTGLDHNSVTRAKRLLCGHFHVVRWIGTERTKGNHGFRPGVTPEPDRLVPNLNFRVLVYPASEGHVTLSFGSVKTG